VAHNAFEVWKKTTRSEKKKLFLRLAEVIEADIENIAKLQTLEMGMLYAHSVAGLKGSANLIRWFANNFEVILADENFETEGMTGKFVYDPIGVLF